MNLTITQEDLDAIKGLEEKFSTTGTKFGDLVLVDYLNFFGEDVAACMDGTCGVCGADSLDKLCKSTDCNGFDEYSRDLVWVPVQLYKKKLTEQEDDIKAFIELTESLLKGKKFTDLSIQEFYDIYKQLSEVSTQKRFIVNHLHAMDDYVAMILVLKQKTIIDDIVYDDCKMFYSNLGDDIYELTKNGEVFYAKYFEVTGEDGETKCVLQLLNVYLLLDKLKNTKQKLESMIDKVRLSLPNKDALTVQDLNDIHARGEKIQTLGTRYKEFVLVDYSQYRKAGAEVCGKIGVTSCDVCSASDDDMLCRLTKCLETQIDPHNWFWIPTSKQIPVNIQGKQFN